ncbi:SPOR domain-containing protein [Rhizobium halophytocola]|uniref:SPOR domain-containing protein n=1 Tax=Rhizobium halophytocola TaxID=735519 RepID=A0ABS4DVX6_9HYPH|nr:SPOR domain-containing protein [Rhizobium halophytocola]MBP1849854.1 hypothetical protein [Rhizobium halophytocola]
MVQKHAALQGDHRGDTFADDDPLAELARIVGFEPPAAEREDVSREPHSDVAEREPAEAPVAAGPVRSQDELDLEAELMREFETHRVPVFAAPAAAAPVPVAADVAAEEPMLAEEPVLAEDDVSEHEQLAADQPEPALAPAEPVFEPMPDAPEPVAEPSHAFFEPEYDDDHTASGGDPADELAAALSVEEMQPDLPEFVEDDAHAEAAEPLLSDEVQFVEAPDGYDDYREPAADTAPAEAEGTFYAEPASDAEPVSYASAEAEPEVAVPELPILDLSGLDMSDWQRGETTDIAPHYAEHHEADRREDSFAQAADADYGAHADAAETIPFEEYSPFEDTLAEDERAGAPEVEPAGPIEAQPVSHAAPEPYFDAPQPQPLAHTPFEPASEDLTDDLVGELEMAVAEFDTDDVPPPRTHLTRPAPGANRPGLPLTNFAFSRTTPVMGRSGIAQPASSPITPAPAPAAAVASEPVRVPAAEPAWSSLDGGEDAARMAEAQLAGQLDMGDLSALDGFASSSHVTPEPDRVAPAPIAAPAPSEAHADFDFSSAFEAQLAENEDFVEREISSAASRQDEPVTSDEAFDPFTDGEFDFDLDELELDLSEFIDDVAPEAAEPTPAPAAQAVAAEPVRQPPVAAAPPSVATASLSPVMHASVERKPAAAVAPAPAPAGPLPFDPSQIAEQDDRPSAIGSLNVPDLNLAEAEPPAQTQDDDFDLESELGSIFAGAAAAETVPPAPQPVSPQAPVSSAPAASAPAPSSSDDFENFQRALEVDLRDNAPRPVREPVATARVALDAGQSGGARRYLLIGSVAAVAVLALGAGYFVLSGDSAGVLSSGEPPIILADKDPIKVLPENPGGTKVPNQDKAVYDRVAGQKTDPQQKTLISSNEEPVDVVQKTLLPESLPEDAEGSGNNATPVGETEDPRLLPGMRSEDSAAGDDGDVTITPRKVRTMIVRSDGTLVAAEEPTPAPQDSGTVATAPALAAPTGEGSTSGASQQDTLGTELRPSAADASVEAGAGAAQGSDFSAPVPSLRPPSSQAAAPVQPAQPLTQAPTETAAAAPAASAPVANTPAPAGGYYIQIASLPSEAEAQKSYRNLAARYASVIGGKGVDIKRADISGKGTYYRVRIPAGDKDAAANMCESYRAAGGSCLIAR